MPLDSHSQVKAIELIQYQLQATLERFEREIEQAQERQVDSSVWPIFGAFISAGALHAKLESDWELFFTWVGAALIYLLTYYVVYRRGIKPLGRYLRKRLEDLKGRDPAQEAERVAREFDQKTSNEMLLAYSLIQRVLSPEEPNEASGIAVYLAEAVHYIHRACSDLVRLTSDEQRARRLILTDQTPGSNLSGAAVQGHRLVWAVNLIRDMLRDIEEANRRLTPPSRSITRQVAHIRDSLLTSIDGALSTVGAST